MTAPVRPAISPAILANIDLTNRCNLAAPSALPTPTCRDTCTSPPTSRCGNAHRDAQRKAFFPAGRPILRGEPTIHPRFLDILKAARSMGFSHLQIATNGIRIARTWNSPGRQGVRPLHHVPPVRRTSDEVYKKTRGLSGLWELKQRAVENARPWTFV